MRPSYFSALQANISLSTDEDGPRRHTFMAPARREAHDYLWLAQDEWMEPEVWAWANSQNDVKKLLLRPCARKNCGNREVSPLQFKECPACDQTIYCSDECKRRDSPSHLTGTFYSVHLLHRC